MSAERHQPSAEPEAGPSSPTKAGAIPPAPARPANGLLAYFGKGQAGPSATASSSSGTTPSVLPAKKKRKPAVAPDQARLGTAAGEDSGWSLAKEPAAEGAEAPKPKGRKKPAKTDDGEEAEKKEMAKRLKAEKKGPKKGAGEASGLPDEPGGDADGLAADSSKASVGVSHGKSSTIGKAGPSAPRTSDTKRKRGPQLKPGPSPSDTALPLSQASTSRSSTGRPSSPPTINLSSSTESDDDLPRPSNKGRRLQILSPSSSLPPFSRSSSTISKGASQADPISIDDSPRQPLIPVIDLASSPIGGKAEGRKKTVFAADQKAVHGFFGKRQTAEGEVTQAPVKQGNASQDKAGPKAAAKGEKVHSFFQSGPKGVPGKLADGWGADRKLGDEWPAPLPGRIWPSHRGCASLTGGPEGSLRKRRKISPASPQSIESFFSRAITFDDTTPPLSPVRPSPPHVQPQNTDHAAIRSVPLRSLASHRESWCERYRPLSADQVLGNEREAVYLRDWLQLLSVGPDGGSSATTKITRRVPRRKAHLEDGWIVDDIGLFDDEEPADDPDAEDFETIEEAPSALDLRPETYPSFGGRLANTILMTGPQGSGKSAAVYAVAEELGWEVFEVYPGIGRRTGSNLMSLVGDVGKNHVITGKVTPKKAKAASAAMPKPVPVSFFGAAPVAVRNGVARKRANQLPMSSQGSQGDPMRLDDSDEEKEEEAEVLEDRKHGFRQSLILLDEADLLFDEEGSFWPAVISLIAESRRPIILTCNDPLRIPIATLPLQAILQFEAPPPSLAISYLGAIAQHETLTHLDPSALHTSSFSSTPNLLAQPTPLPPNGHEPIPTFDLRRAITQMQLDRNVAPYSSSRPMDSPSKDLICLAKSLEQRSFADAWISPRPWATIEMNELDRYGDTPDDLLGVHALSKPEVHPDRVALPGHSAEMDMEEYLLSLVPHIPERSPEDLGLKQYVQLFIFLSQSLTETIQLPALRHSASSGGTMPS
ncbi:uncharacterized protein MKK02DRAFT_29508 [Dioszegia hungarica]|uniref:AAA+ ATPase domain-containing protein n=1 Tax=Dioszegia hungarica TaxID=4972 RepID=A0AA38LYY0_9TREE|nr:uncharacterized protein MKK02DRAFT_29508 [Dioszegia hungarica]KAI9639449.1 hypothetical protein MKK02DRAFT_29508 [Dioszegia hungarica]